MPAPAPAPVLEPPLSPWLRPLKIAIESEESQRPCCELPTERSVWRGTKGGLQRMASEEQRPSVRFPAATRVNLEADPPQSIQPSDETAALWETLCQRHQPSHA